MGVFTDKAREQGRPYVMYLHLELYAMRKKNRCFTFVILSIQYYISKRGLLASRCKARRFNCVEEKINETGILKNVLTH